MKRLRELREQAGLTLAQAAKKTGLRAQYLSNYELGKRSPDYTVLKRLADFYQVSTDYLLEFSDEPLPSAAVKRIKIMAKGGGNQVIEVTEEEFEEIQEIYRIIHKTVPKHFV